MKNIYRRARKGAFFLAAIFVPPYILFFMYPPHKKYSLSGLAPRDYIAPSFGRSENKKEKHVLTSLLA